MNSKILIFLAAAMTAAIPVAHTAEFVLDWDMDANGGVIATGQVISSPNDPANPMNPGGAFEPYSAWGIDIQSFNGVQGIYDTAITFDAANPTGGDWDLGGDPSLNNILIIGENFVDNNHDGLVDSPDDQAGAGSPNSYIELFMNDWDATSAAITFVDVDSPGHMVEFFLDGVLVHSEAIPAGSNGNVQTITFNGFGAFDQMMHTFGGSGGIGEIALSTPVPEPCTFVVFGAAGVAAWRRKKRQTAEAEA